MTLILNGTTGITSPGGDVSVSQSLSGNLTFTGTGNRITGDFSNATTNRVLFQTSTTNGSTYVAAIPNGTSSAAGFQAFASSTDPSNTSLFQTRVALDNNECAIYATRTGSGTYLPITFYTGGSERVRVDTSGNVGIGTTAPNAKLELSLVSNPGGPGFYGGANNLLLFAASGSAYGEPAVKFQESGTDVGAVIAGKNTANGAMAIVFANRSTSSTTSTLTEKMRINQDGNVGIGTSTPAQKLHVVGAIVGQSTDNYFGNYSSGAYVDIGNLGTNEVWLDTRSDTLTNVSLQFRTKGAGEFVWTQGASERMRIDTSGNLQVGGTSANKKLFVSDPFDRTEATAQFNIGGSGYQAYHYLDASAYYIGQNSNSRELRMYAGSSPTTGVKLTPGATAWASLSDEREKDIIEPIVGAAIKLSGLRAIIGKYKTDDAGTRRSFLIAQDVKAVLPEAVSEDAEGMLSLRYTDVIPLLVAAIQELKTEVDALKGAA